MWINFKSQTAYIPDTYDPAVAESNETYSVVVWGNDSKTHILSPIADIYSSDEDNDYIEKEINFYNFDENLLQNRPLEIDQLIKALLDLKDALI